MKYCFLDKIVISILFRYLFKHTSTTNDVECWNRLLPKTYILNCHTAINQWNNDDVTRIMDAKRNYERLHNPHETTTNAVAMIQHAEESDALHEPSNLTAFDG